MREELEKLISLGIGIFAFSKEKVEKLVGELVEKGDLSKNEAKDLINKLITKGEEERAEIDKYISEKVNAIINKLNLAKKEDIIDEERIREIIREELEKSK